MKATKTEIIRLAQLAQNDIASGRVSTHAQQAVEALADYQNSAIDLLELALEEALKKKFNKPLLDSFGFLFGQALEALRFDIESGYKTASDIAESVRKRLITASQSGASILPCSCFLFSVLALPNSILVTSCGELSSICSKRLAKQMPAILVPLTFSALSPIW